jgi:hypothetical protein
MKTQSITDRVASATEALATMQARCLALEEAEKDATRIFASDPNDANADKVREARNTLDAWKRGRQEAQHRLDAAHSELASTQSTKALATARALAEAASPSAMRKRFGPGVETIIAGRRMIDDGVAEIYAVREAQHAEIEQSDALARSAGAMPLGIRPAQPTHALAEVVAHFWAAPQKSDVRWWCGNAGKDEIELAVDIFRLVGLGPPLPEAVTPLAKQIDQALNGEDVYAAARPAQTAE